MLFSDSLHIAFILLAPFFIKLIRKGATLITSTQEIIEEFEFLSFKEINDSKTKAIRSKIVKKEYQEIYNLIKNGASN